MMNTLKNFPARAVVCFADWPKPLRDAVEPQYLEPGIHNDCPAKLAPGGNTVTLRSHCLRDAPTITIPRRLATIHDAAIMSHPAPQPPPQNPKPEPPSMPLDPTRVGSDINTYLETLPQ